MGSLSTHLEAEISLQQLGPHPRRTISWSFLLLITVLAAALRLHAISVKSFWFDETLSAGLATLPWSQFLTALWHHELNMAPYFVLLHLWAKFGTTPSILRALSAVISAATIPPSLFSR